MKSAEKKLFQTLRTSVAKVEKYNYRILFEIELELEYSG